MSKTDSTDKAAARAEYMRRWHQANRDSQRAKMAAYYQKTKEIQKAKRAEKRANQTVRDADLVRQKAWREANKTDQAEKQRAWRQANRERKALGDRAYRLKNAERVRRNKERWTSENIEAVRRIKRNWASKRPHLSRIYAHNRRIRSAGKKLFTGIVQRLMILQRGCCANCATSLKRSRHHIDHVIPLALGGANTDDNVQLLCPPCNQRKSSKHPIDWAQSEGRLL